MKSCQTRCTSDAFKDLYWVESSRGGQNQQRFRIDQIITLNYAVKKCVRCILSILANSVSRLVKIQRKRKCFAKSAFLYHVRGENRFCRNIIVDLTQATWQALRCRCITCIMYVRMFLNQSAMSLIKEVF